MRVSLEGKLAAIVLACVLFAAAASATVTAYTHSIFTAIAVGLLLALPLSLLLVRRFTHGMNRVLQALADGVASFRDGDFSMSLGAERNDELGDLVKAYNRIGEILRRERQDLFQRELLLDTVIQATPSAMVLCDARGHIVHSNTAARKLFNKGRRLEGHVFENLLRANRPEFLPVITAGNFEGLFSVRLDDEDEIFQLQRGAFTLNQRAHRLYLFKRMTREVNRQEVATWKKVIRVISHELNNSLAPIHSLAHSAGNSSSAATRKDWKRCSPESASARTTCGSSSTAMRASPSCRRRARRRWSGAASSKPSASLHRFASWASCRNGPAATIPRSCSRCCSTCCAMPRNRAPRRRTSSWRCAR